MKSKGSCRRFVSNHEGLPFEPLALFAAGPLFLRRASLVILVLTLGLITTGGSRVFRVSGAQQTPRQLPIPDSLSAAEFSRLVREMSEEGGYFHSDNFISNETSYLHIVDKLQELGATGNSKIIGAKAYIGVGPEQNFTYIAKIRPRIAFIVDIRRQAIIQHLFYKALFELSPTRTAFLSRLLSRPMPAAKLRRADAPLADLVDYFVRSPADEKAYTANLADIRKTIQQTFQFQLSEEDAASLEYIYKNFRSNGLDISFQMDGYWGYFPNFKEILLATDLRGRQGNFLASPADYEFIRGMQHKNLIIPVVGDFAGKKALAAVSDYLRQHGLTVTAFYTSNVEQYLFQNGVFAGFVANVRKLPFNDHSLFIRAVPGRFAYSHPARQPGQRSVTLLEEIAVFLQDFDSGRYHNYFDLVTTHYIAPDNSPH